jgi:glycosyltransferase involved in cell wall biosynthesis
VFPVDSGDSIALWTEAVTQRLSQKYDIVVYGNRQRSQPKVAYYGSVEFRRVSAAIDMKLGNRVLNKLSKWLKLSRSTLSSQFYYLTYILQVALDLRSQACDIVHLYSFSQFVPIIRWLNPQIKIVLHSHEEWLSQFERNQIARRIKQADLILGCSQYLTATHQRQFPQFADRCHTVYNGVNPTAFCKSRRLAQPNSKNIVFVGRVSPEKGVHTLIAAFNQLAELDPDVGLTIVGPLVSLSREYLTALSDDPKVRELAPLCDLDYPQYLFSQLSAHAAQRLKFVGSVEHDQVCQYLQQADILVNPSFSESFGLSVVEAMAFELPVIVAQVGGMTDTVASGQTGLFFEAGNVEQLTETLQSLLSDRGRCLEMGRSGRQRVLAHFTWDAVVKELAIQYESLKSQIQVPATQAKLAPSKIHK